MTLKRTTSAIALFSGGLDSLLAARLLMEQGIHVQAVKFVTPFFGYDLLDDPEGYRLRMKEKFGIEVILRDVSEPYLKLLRDPPHGYGKNFNPCVDCKILLITEARRLLAEFGASFLVSGEVVGQRPMSQRRDTLRIIERDSGSEGLLLRPLCAKLLQPTRPELEGLVDRDRLLAFSGRSRSPQMELAARFGIEDYASPAGGCMLTDPILAGRIRRFYGEQERFTAVDIRLLLIGRSFRLPNGGLLTMGRDQKENDRIERLVLPGDWIITPAADWPGPTAILRFSEHPEDLQAAAGLVARYSRKKPENYAPLPVTARGDAGSCELEGFIPSTETITLWRR
jgi:tRNA-uridine 2-sulfurtransferase